MSDKEIANVELFYSYIHSYWELQLSTNVVFSQRVKEYYYIFTYITNSAPEEKRISKEELYFNVYATLLKYGVHVIIDQYRIGSGLKLDEDNYNKLVLLLKMYEHIKIEDDLV